MRFNETKNKLGYPCIFFQSTEEAVNNLLDLILENRCGFDEGAALWRKTLKEWLKGNYDLLELNDCGASFSEGQWRNILEGVVRGLEKP